MSQLILHIPHSSTEIPDREGYVLNESSIDKEILKLTDWYTDDLFNSASAIMVVAEFSRIYCDPERFADDEQEEMARSGMGVLYERTDEGELLRIVTPVLKEKVLSQYYRPHHIRLSEAVKNQLNTFSKATIIDCHSFSDMPFVRDLNSKPNRPDFNIGTDSFHTSPILIDTSAEFFQKKGFTVGIDWPYSGTIVPVEYYKKNKQVQSIMLEVNRKLYLKAGSNERSENYPEVKKIVQQYLKTISRLV